MARETRKVRTSVKVKEVTSATVKDALSRGHVWEALTVSYARHPQKGNAR
jgi:hypothetical protein